MVPLASLQDKKREWPVLAILLAAQYGSIRIDEEGGTSAKPLEKEAQWSGSA